MKSVLVILLVFEFGFAATAIDNVDEAVYDDLDTLFDDLEDNAEYDAISTTPTAFSKPVSRPSSGKSSKPTTMPDVRPTNKPTKEPKKSSLLMKFIQLLFTPKNKAKPENPDLKYQQPAKELVSELLQVKKAVIAMSKPLIKYGKLMAEDFVDMVKKVDKAMKNNNMFQAKHLVGDYFIAVNRRFISLFFYAASSGLFDMKSAGNESIVSGVKRDFDEHSKKAKYVVEYILKNFNQFRVSDGIPDGPYVRLGIQTAKIYIQAFKQTVKMAKIQSSMMIDMIADMVRLGVDMKNREAAVQRAAASILSMVRRQTKIEVAVARAYNVKKCHKTEQTTEKAKRNDVEL